MNLNYKFKMPNGLNVEVVEAGRYFEVWYEVDDILRMFGGEYETFEQAIEYILARVQKSR